MRTNGEWSVYGGHWETEREYDYYEERHKEIRKQRTIMDQIRDEVRLYKVDWDATDVPKSSVETCFEGTEQDNSNAEALLGTIYLCNNLSYMIGVSHADKRFGDYIRQFFELANDVDRVKDLFGE